MPTTRRLDPRERSAQILAAGLDLLDEAGPTAVSAEAVAARAEASRPLVMHYFGSLSGLRAAVGVAAAQRLADEALAAEIGDGERRVATRMRSYVESVGRHPQASLAVLRGAWTADPEVAAALDRLRRSLFGDLVGGAVALGLPASSGLTVMARAWMALLEEAVVGWLGQDELSRDDLLFLLEDSFARLVDWLGEPAVVERLS